MVAHPSNRHLMPLALVRHLPFSAVQITSNQDAAVLSQPSDGLVEARPIVSIFAFPWNVLS